MHPPMSCVMITKYFIIPKWKFVENQLYIFFRINFIFVNVEESKNSFINIIRNFRIIIAYYIFCYF